MTTLSYFFGTLFDAFQLNLLQYFLLGYWLYRPGLGFLPSEASDSVQSLIENRNMNQLEAVLEV